MSTSSLARIASAVACAGLLAAPADFVNADSPQTTSPKVSAASDIDAGRYIVTVGGCNDCHTPNWFETDGAVPESQWLVGSPIGWRGPWGTPYASNLRLFVQDLSEDAFVQTLATRKARPPMPWMNMNRLSAADARQLYRFIRSLGAAGERMPLAIAPGVEPATAYFALEPVLPEAQDAPAKSATTP